VNLLVIRGFVQVSSAVAGLWGFVYFAQAYELWSVGDVRCLVRLLAGVYSFYVGYVVVMRLSPKALLHFVILGGFWLFLLGGMLKDLVSLHGALGGLFYILLIFGIVWLCRRTRKFLTRLFFHTEDSSIKPS
jgi:hypothetical protein